MVADLDRMSSQSSRRASPMNESPTNSFLNVMEAFPYEELWELLNDPKPIDNAILEHVIRWCRPKAIGGTTFVEAVLDSNLLETRSDVLRKVKEGGMKWNGRRITDMNMPIEFLAPGWAVIQLGKKTHRVVLNRILGSNHWKQP